MMKFRRIDLLLSIKKKKKEPCIIPSKTLCLYYVFCVCSLFFSLSLSISINDYPEFYLCFVFTECFCWVLFSLVDHSFLYICHLDFMSHFLFSLANKTLPSYSLFTSPLG